MSRKPKTHIQAALDHQKSEDKKAREAKRASSRKAQLTLPHTPRAKRPKKTKWVQLTIDHAIQTFDERLRHEERQSYVARAVGQPVCEPAGQVETFGEQDDESSFCAQPPRQAAAG